MLPAILSPLRKTVFGRRRRAGAGAPATAPRRLARNVAESIDEAMDLGLWDHAEQLARAAAPLAASNGRLTEALARLALGREDPEAALRILDRCRTSSSSLRLLRTTCLLYLGARAEAHIDLLRWSGRSSAPLDARLLLGLIERRRDDEAAIAGLQRNLRHLEDPRTLQALLLISVDRGRAEQARIWAERLRRCFAGCADAAVWPIDLMLESLGVDGVQREAEPTPQAVRALALELIAFEPAITTLADAQVRRPHRPTARLLRAATEIALDDVCDAAAALGALARLSLVLDDHDAARDYARRGLEENPMSATLAMLADQIDPAPAPRPARSEAA